MRWMGAPGSVWLNHPCGAARPSGCPLVHGSWPGGGAALPCRRVAGVHMVCWVHRRLHMGGNTSTSNRCAHGRQHSNEQPLCTWAAAHQPTNAVHLRQGPRAAHLEYVHAAGLQVVPQPKFSQVDLEGL